MTGADIVPASPHTVPDWRLVGRQGLGPGTIDAALACDAATLFCRPHTFDFAKTHTAHDDVQLRLSHRADCACKDGTLSSGYRHVSSRSIERLIPAVTGDLDDATRARIETGRLYAAGRALFAHVAHLIVLAENQPPGKRTPRFLPVGGRPFRRKETYERGRICAARGCGTVLSTYNPSRSCELHHADIPPSG